MKSWREECGVFGIWNHPDASRLSYLGLYAIQHRGQESAGIVSLRGEQHHVHKGLGLVGDVFSEEALTQLPGHAAIGHVRYSTTGLNFLNNAQPLTAQLLNGPVAIAHNGNIVNAEALRQDLKGQGAIFQGTNDTEVLLHMIARNPSGDLLECLAASLKKVEGAYSLAVLSHRALFAARDPYGFRPLVLGEMSNPSGGTSYVIASETCAFDLIGARLKREIEPGEIFWVDEHGEHSIFLDKKPVSTAKCVFEHVYFARPDSVVFGRSVYEARQAAGRILAREKPADVDLIVPVPDSGVPAAIGYAAESRIPFELGIIRNHYIGRTFIQPHQSIRDFGVKIKLNPQAAILKGKRVVVVDDSLVRGTTSRKIISLVRQAGATEVHLRVAAPPTMGPCYYGVDTPEKSELIAATHSLDQIREFVGADSLGYLSLTGLQEAVKSEGRGYCSACFDGKYPTPLYER
ncbi:MAG: amidophosphoribosyltransferase [Bdellovibrionaceae bacterium]|nr:amidophosphoribosyltransferase [Pseudobdellovibrionaceae bacterium]